jgi:hypothetical protein
MKFTYSSGQRPLDGYTLKRGIGQGGFGEVYYGVSDGGKEVALKLLRGNHDIELRGVGQCLNLKHPHLVNLYDQRSDAQGDHWVIMEYIAGEPLSVVLNRHPRGLPAELAQQWFTALGKAISYLHDHGIVHRDLKPGNIFLENGFLKVGDYGLSKCISNSQRTAQTQSIGTVYYMAPEIATGNYNKQIDIYAAGIILYEMLTGRVPFDGESAAEILMKHLTSPPDLSKVPEPFVPVVARALAKNPAHRYASMAEMVKAVEAASAPAARQPVVTAPVGVARPVPIEQLPSVLPAVTLRGQLAELAGSLALAPVLAGVMVLVIAALARHNPNVSLVWMGNLFFLTVAVCWAVMIPAKFWTNARGDSLTRRVIMTGLGVVVGLGALWLTGWTPADGGAALRTGGSERRQSPHATWLTVAAGYSSYFALSFMLVRWWKMTEPTRPRRIALFPVLAVAFWALVLVFLWPAWPEHPGGPLALITSSIIVQCVSPWEPPPPPLPRRVRLRHVG